MIRFAADPARLFPDLPPLDGFDAAGKAGFSGVELPQPYESPAPETHRAITRSGLGLAMISGPPPNYAGGVPGFAAHKDGGERFRHDLRRTLRYAELLCPDLVELKLASGSVAISAAELTENLLHAAELAPKARFAIKPVSGALFAGDPLADARKLVEIVDKIGVDHVGLILEIGGSSYNLHDALELCADLGKAIAHVHIASEPPGLGGLYTALEDSGYEGWVSAVFVPSRRISSRPAWLPETV